MILKYLIFAMILMSIALLLSSVKPTRSISRDHEALQRSVFGWKVLLYLIYSFIFGYVVVAWFLLQGSLTSAASVVSFILFGGSLFVVLVTRMSLISIKSIKHMAALERHHALHDELTNLPNRTLLYEYLNQAILSARRKDEKFCVLLMDLDQFKEINDTLGHHCGDRLLQQVAPRLKNLFRESDTIARIGGDEFAAVLPCTDLNGAITLCEKIIVEMQQPFVVEGHSLKVGVSIGISEFPRDAETVDALLQKSDVAMYIAKRNSSGYSVYNPDEDPYTMNRLMVVGKLHDAICNNELTLYYQPILGVRERDFWGFEALVRWRQPELGLLQPQEFVPIAEQSGIIKELTQWVLVNAIRQLKLWHMQHPDLNLSINLSVKDVQDSQFVNLLAGLLQENQVRQSSLNLEITESSMMADSKRAQEILNQIHELGPGISIDDFGTGFSSLSYLKHMPARSIKIDRSFVHNMLNDDNDAVIVRSTIDLAHNMGRTVIAEGVESKEVLDILEILGCDYAQGFHFCTPMNVIEATEWLEKYQPKKTLPEDFRKKQAG